MREGRPGGPNGDWLDDHFKLRFQETYLVPSYFFVSTRRSAARIAAHGPTSDPAVLTRISLKTRTTRAVNHQHRSLLGRDAIHYTFILRGRIYLQSAGPISLVPRLGGWERQTGLTGRGRRPSIATPAPGGPGGHECEVTSKIPLVVILCHTLHQGKSSCQVQRSAEWTVEVTLTSGTFHCRSPCASRLWDGA